MEDGAIYYIKLIIAAILIIISVLISVADVAIDVGDTAVDAVTVGTVGAVTNIGDLASEIVLEIIQTSMMSVGMLLLTDEEWWLIIIKIIIIIIASLVDIILSVAGFAPYIDFVETGAEVITEIVQNAVLISSAATLL